jgi:predicted adenylyl cyclase CyaB
MPSNIEIKARVKDFSRLIHLSSRLSDRPEALLVQEDIFFNISAGRLKLRIFSAGEGELIFYQRADAKGPKQSKYSISPTSSPESLRTVLGGALGIRGTVRKKRHLFLAGQTRIHLDEVEGLGNFMELKVVLGPDQSLEEGIQIADNLMEKLGIRKEDLIEGAYLDLLEQR